MKVKALLYTTRQSPYLYRKDDDSFELSNKMIYEGFDPCYVKYYGSNNGKIVAECEYEVEGIEYFDDDFGEGELYTKTLNIEELIKRSCIAINDLYEYLQNKYFQYEGYAIHIKNLHIFDKPKKLKECHKKYGGNYSPTYYMPISKAPQNMMKVWLYENGEWVMYILISIQAQWMCKILNKEKDVEVRKKVLEVMLK